MEGINQDLTYLCGPTLIRPEALPLKERLLVHLPWVIKLAWTAARIESLINLLGALIGGLAPAINLLLTKRAVDAIVAGGAASDLFPPLLTFALLLIMTTGFQALREVFQQRASWRIWPYLEGMIIAKAGSLSLRQFDQTETYDVLQRASQDLGPAATRLFQNLPQIINAIVAIIAALSILTGASPWLGLIGLLLIPPLVIINTRRARRHYERNRALAPEWRYAGYFNNLLTDRNSGTELRAYQLPTFFIDRWRGVYGRIRSQMLGSFAHTYREFLLSLLGTVLATAGSLLLIARAIGAGGATLGDVVALTGALAVLNGQVSWVAGLIGSFYADLLPIGDVQTFLRLESDERPLTEGAPFPGGTIRFERVSFQYPGRERPSLDQIDLTLHPGERIALVGPNGAGKSTLVKLLLGLYQPTSGRITIDGVDLQEIDPAALREQVSCIFQEFARFDLTVAENVAIGRLGATESAIAQAGREAGLDEITAKLPQGYQTLLGKTFKGGTDLSGGQWQRVALARAFVRDASLIILDEPTAALDARAELQLFHQFTDLTAGKTALLISHRLGVARLADRIIVLEGGRIAEEGSHEALVAANGLYAELFGAQAQFYQEEVAAV